MTEAAHLWAIGFENTVRAEEVRQEIAQLGGPQEYLQLLDMAVVVRWDDGSLTCQRDGVSLIEHVAGSSMVGLLIGLVVGAPLVGAAIGGVVGGAASAVASKVGIDNAFIRDVADMMSPGTSALFVLDNVGDQEVILKRIRGLGGAILKTNVDLEQAKEIQSALSSKGDVATR